MDFLLFLPQSRPSISITRRSQWVLGLVRGFGESDSNCGLWVLGCGLRTRAPIKQLFGDYKDLSLLRCGLTDFRVQCRYLCHIFQLVREIILVQWYCARNSVLGIKFYSIWNFIVNLNKLPCIEVDECF